MDYLDKIGIGLIIENPNKLIPWFSTKEEILNLFDDKKAINENYFMVKVLLTDLPFIHNLGLNFENDKLTKIELDVYGDITNADITLKSKFYIHQRMLEKCFGNAKKQCVFENLFKNITPDDEVFYWKFKNIKIVHKIWDRFGFEEKLEIFINK